MTEGEDTEEGRECDKNCSHRELKMSSERIRSVFNVSLSKSHRCTFALKVHLQICSHPTIR